MSDSYLGLDQQYEIHLNVTAASIAAQVNTEVSDSVTDLSLRWGSRTEKHSSSAAVVSDHQMSDCVKRGLWDMLTLLAATDLSWTVIPSDHSTMMGWNLLFHSAHFVPASFNFGVKLGVLEESVVILSKGIKTTPIIFYVFIKLI